MITDRIGLHSVLLPLLIGQNLSQSIYLAFTKNFTFALEASLLGQMFIFRTISQPRTLSADIPAAGRGLITKYFRAK